MVLYQCNRCGFWSRAREAVLEHFSSVHRHEKPISIDDFAVRPAPFSHQAPVELPFQAAYGSGPRNVPGF